MVIGQIGEIQKLQKTFMIFIIKIIMMVDIVVHYIWFYFSCYFLQNMLQFLYETEHSNNCYN